jgi:hypothetical protein
MFVVPAVVGGLLALAVGVLQALFVHPAPRWEVPIRVVVAAVCVAICAAVGLGATLGCELSGARCGVTWPGGLGGFLAIELSLALHWAASRGIKALLEEI